MVRLHSPSMKRITVILALTTLYGVTVAALAASPLVAAGVPQLINYQGRLTDPAGGNVADGVYTLAFKIYDTPAGGMELWSETLPVQVTDGLLTTQLGTGTAIPANLFSGGANRYLGVTVNLDPEMPRVPLSSVAYAYQAKDADVATLAQDLTCAGCVSAGEIAADAVGSTEIAANAVGSSEITDNSILGVDIVDGAVGTSQVDPTQVQLRVSGTAPAGEYVTAINQDGTVTTAADATNAYTAGPGLVLTGTQFAIPPEGVTAIEITAGAVVGGLGGDVADGSLTADDLGPSSVGGNEIAPNVVGAIHIAADAVGASEIAAGAVGTSEVLDNSLKAVDIDDEPGVASNTEGVAAITMDGTIQTLLSRSISGPEPGYVLGIATAQVSVGHTNGTFSTANFGVSTTAGVFPLNQDVAVEVPSNAPTGTYRQAVTVHGLFSTAGGADNFYFLGDEGGGSWFVQDIQFTLIYFPTAHGTVVATAASGGETISYESADPPLVPSAGGEPVQAEASDPVSMQSELAEVKARMQKIEEQLSLSRPGTGEKR